jgi:hypothetical protein
VGAAGLAGASLNALAVEGKLPAYAATIGQVETKLQKDAFVSKLARLARQESHVLAEPTEGCRLVSPCRSRRRAPRPNRRAAPPSRRSSASSR